MVVVGAAVVDSVVVVVVVGTAVVDSVVVVVVVGAAVVDSVVVVVVLSPLPSPEPVSKRVYLVIVRSLGKLVAFHFNVLATLVFAGRSSVSSVEYSIQIGQPQTSFSSNLNPVI